MNISMRKAFQISTLVAAVMAVGSVAAADVCKSPKVVVKNDRSTTIKVTKIQYFDGCDKKWRTEDVAATEIPAGGSHTFTDNLEYVQGCALPKFKLYRAVRQSTGSAYGDFAWGSELVPDEGTNVKCGTDVKYTIHAHE